MEQSKKDPESKSFTALGNPTQHFPVRNLKLNRGLRIGLGILLILLAVAALLTGFFTSWTAVSSHGRAALLQTLPLALLVFLVSLGLGIFLLVFTHRHWQDGVSLYEKGFAVQTGEKIQTGLWDRMERYDAHIEFVKFATSVIGEKMSILLEDDQGQKFTLPGRYANMTELIQQVRSAVLPRLYAKSVREMNQGKAILFHPDLSATRAGLEVNAGFYPWSALSEPHLAKSTLQLKQASDDQVLFKAKYKNIRNLELLLSLFANPPLP